MKAQVLLPKIFNFSFTYETTKEKLTPGDIVEVPFGKEKAIGVVWTDKSFVPKDIKIKNIHKKIGKISLNKNFINFMKWFAMYIKGCSESYFFSKIPKVWEVWMK